MFRDGPPDNFRKPPSDRPEGEFRGPPMAFLANREIHLSPRSQVLFDESDTNGFYFVVWSPLGTLVKQSTNAPTALARPTPDRASLEDPTTEFTARSILSDNLPLRVTMALFVKVNLPDPFENAEPAKVKLTIPDDPAKALGNPPLPRP